VERIPLSDFDSVESLQGRLNDSQLPSDIPTNALGGIVNHTFPLPKLYRIALAVSGRTTQNGNEETFLLEKTVNVSRRPTLQVYLSSFKLPLPIRSTRPSRSPKFPDQVRPIKLYTTCGGAAVRRRTRDRKVAGSTPGRGALKSTTSTQPSIPVGLVYRVPAACMAGVRRGAFTCVGWQVTLCDPIWQVTFRSSEMGFPWRAISAFTFFVPDRVRWCMVE